MGHMGNGAYGNGDTGDNGVQGTWAMRPTGAKWYRGYGAHTWAMGHMDDVAQGTMGYGGMGYMGNGAHKQWRHRGNGVQGVWGTRGMEQMGNGVHVQWGQWVTGVWGTGGYGAHGQ